MQSRTQPAAAVTDEIRAAFKKYFDETEHGGSLHFLLEEHKFDTRTVERCLRESNMEEDIEGARLCKILVAMSMKDRGELLKEYL